jgi:nitrite reductase/ring-hydroxylating ferredoxin subunit
MAGITDYSAIQKEAAGTGALHGILNSMALLVHIASLRARHTGNRELAFVCSLAGMALLGVSGYLGGELSYRHRVGVNHAPTPTGDTWTRVMPLVSLEHNTPTRAEVNGQPVLLFRQGVAVYAISAVCSHAGGPLDEGRVVDGLCIECPWHQSIFDMRDGRLVHSPSVYDQPRYETRVQDGQIEVRPHQHAGDAEGEQAVALGTAG